MSKCSFVKPMSDKFVNLSKEIQQGITFLQNASYIGNTLQVNKNSCKLFMQSN